MSPLTSWLIFGSGIVIGVAFGLIIGGLNRSAKDASAPWLFWCPHCRRPVKTQWTEEG